MENSHLISLVTQALIRYFAGDQRRIQHALKVHAYTNVIADMENRPQEERLLLSVTALLHDVGIKVAEEKYGSSAGPYQEKEGPAEAMRILKEFPLSEAFIERVCYLIAHHHTYDVTDSMDYQILIEADFLVYLYEEQASEHAIISAYLRYFKTKGGKSLLRQLNPGIMPENKSIAAYVS